MVKKVGLLIFEGQELKRMSVEVGRAIFGNGFAVCGGGVALVFVPIVHRILGGEAEHGFISVGFG